MTDSAVTTFAKSIASLIGGKYRAPAESYDARDVAYIDLPDKVQIRVSMGCYSQKPNQASLIINPLDVPHDVIASGAFSYDKAGKYYLADIMVTTTRASEAIAKDIKRRLIQPSQAGIAARRAVAVEYAQRQDDLEAAVMSFNRTYDLVITDEEYHGKKWYRGEHGNSQISNDRKSATFSLNSPSVSGRINADGTLTIDHITSLSAVKFNAMITAIKGAKG